VSICWDNTDLAIAKSLLNGSFGEQKCVKVGEDWVHDQAV
jgi:hypothetical protein